MTYFAAVSVAGLGSFRSEKLSFLAPRFSFLFWNWQLGCAGLGMVEIEYE